MGLVHKVTPGSSPHRSLGLSSSSTSTLSGNSSLRRAVGMGHGAGPDLSSLMSYSTVEKSSFAPGFRSEHTFFA